MSDEEAHSGSRWEPQQASAADQPTERHEAPADGTMAVAEAEHPTTTPNALPPETPSARTGRARRAVLAAIGAGAGSTAAGAASGAGAGSAGSST